MNTEKEYGEIINGQDTYESIATALQVGKSILIGWTDEMSTHYDILFTKDPSISGTNIQGGIRRDDLFVSIMRIGCFGFEIENTDTHWGYYSEKFNSNFGEMTGQKLAELINGVKKEL